MILIYFVRAKELSAEGRQSFNLVGGLQPYVVTLMPEFDAFLMVDWSASSRPAKGADSI
jgi:hypothetical protein